MRSLSVYPVAASVAEADRPRFTLQELSGSMGDLGTFLPLTIAVAITAKMDFGLILIFAGIMHVLSGLVFRQPMPVQPMKAIAAVAITEGLLPGQIAAAGMLMGVLMIILAMTRTVDAAVRYVPRSVVRGIQAGVGAKLTIKGVQWLLGIPLIGADSLLVAAAVATALIWPRLKHAPVLLVMFFAGFILIAAAQPGLLTSLSLQPPMPIFVWPTPDQWWTGLGSGALPQLPLTLLNSVVAVCALSADLYPGRGVAPRRVAASVGLMNLLSVPFGGLPMCHGAGGLAAQHRFGARTGGSVVMLGSLKILAGLLFGAGLLPLLQAYPRSILAVMLILAGATLAKPARDSLRGWPLVVVLATAGLILAFNTAVGTIAGLAIAGLAHLLRQEPSA